MKQVDAFASSAFVLSQQRPRYKLGLQLFTVRAAMRQGLDGTLKRIAAIGYEELDDVRFRSGRKALLRPRSPVVRAAAPEPQPHDA